jgi:hypothetical protein
MLEIMGLKVVIFYFVAIGAGDRCVRRALAAVMQPRYAAPKNRPMLRIGYLDIIDQDYDPKIPKNSENSEKEGALKTIQSVQV